MHIVTQIGGKPFKCTKCDKSFTNNSGLINHMETHTGEKPHQCGLCEESFYKNDKLKHTHGNSHR